MVNTIKNFCYTFFTKTSSFTCAGLLLHLKIEYETEVHEISHICDTMLKGQLHVTMPFPYFSCRFMCVALVVSRWEQGHYDLNEQLKSCNVLLWGSLL